MDYEDTSLQRMIHNCENENIRFTGFIQSHGVFFALNSNFEVTAVSENVELLGFLAASVLDRDFFHFVTELAKFRYDLKSLTRHVPSLLGDFRIGYRLWSVIAIAHEHGFFIEFEELTEGLSQVLPLNSPPTIFIPNEFATVEGCYNHLLAELNKVWKFDHIMLYRFLHDASGQVIAEMQNAGGPRYLNHRFPPSDIPKIVRDLYLKVQYRQVNHVDARPVRIIAGDASNLDLTYSYLRSVSPIHLQYMRNMGIVSSLSFPIVTNQELWGLVTCHNYQHRPVPFQVRRSFVETLQNFAISMRTMEILEDNRQRIEFDKNMLHLDQGLTWNETMLSLEKENEVQILNNLNLQGFAIIDDGRNWSFGACPANEVVQELLEIFSYDRTRPLFTTEHSAQRFRYLENWPSELGGLIVVQSHFLADKGRWKYAFLGFRAEYAQSIKWAGKPEKLVEDHGGRLELHPRRSFATWIEERRGHSLPWTSMDKFKVKKLFNTFLQRRELRTRPYLN